MTPQDKRTKVAAVVVTYNRWRVLCATLEAVLAQDRPPDHVLVVDNASTDETRYSTLFPGVEILRLSENVGFGAGLTAGIHHLGSAVDAFWILDDDSVPALSALTALLETATALPNVGLIGLASGVRMVCGVPRSRRRLAPARTPGLSRDVREADAVLVDCALVRADVIRRVGPFRSDLFMMLEDYEFAMRVKRAGIDIVSVEEPLVRRLHLGSTKSTSTEEPSTAWRGYYQTRNGLRIALDNKSLPLLAGWAWRQAAFTVGALWQGDDAFIRIRLRARGARDAIRGRMGRTLTPGSHS